MAKPGTRLSTGHTAPAAPALRPGNHDPLPRRAPTSFKLQLFVSLHNFGGNHALNLRRERTQTRPLVAVGWNRARPACAEPTAPRAAGHPAHVQNPVCSGARASSSRRRPCLGQAASGQLIAVSSPSLIKSSTYCFRH